MLLNKPPSTKGASSRNDSSFELLMGNVMPPPRIARGCLRSLSMFVKKLRQARPESVEDITAS
jgi:hypothetical protein